jgi:hypothetical protein
VRRRRDRGRFFTPVWEGRRIDSDVLSHQEAFGQTVQWYYFDPDGSSWSETFYEGRDYVSGRRWKGPHPMPVLSAIRMMGARRSSDDGLYTYDTVRLRMSYEQIRKTGFAPDAVYVTETHLRDRFVYAQRVFSISEIVAAGQFDPSQHYLMVHVLGTQLREDELVNDIDFQDYLTAPLEDAFMTESKGDWNIKAGGTFNWSIQWNTAKNPANYRAEIQVRAYPQAPDPAVLTLTNATGGGITITPITGGATIAVQILPSVTAGLNTYQGTTLVYDLMMTNNTDSTDIEYLIEGNIFIQPSSSR